MLRIQSRYWGIVLVLLLFVSALLYAQDSSAEQNTAESEERNTAQSKAKNESDSKTQNESESEEVDNPEDNAVTDDSQTKNENNESNTVQELLFIVEGKRSPAQFRKSLGITGIVMLSAGTAINIATAMMAGFTGDFADKTKTKAYLPLQDYDLLFMLGTVLISVGTSTLIVSNTYYPNTVEDLKKFTRTQLITGLASSLAGLTVLSSGLIVWGSEQEFADMNITSGMLIGGGSSLMLFGIPSLLLGIFN